MVHNESQTQEYTMSLDTFVYYYSIIAISSGLGACLFIIISTRYEKKKLRNMPAPDPSTRVPNIPPPPGYPTV
jgi:hypothetical protein